MNVTKAEMVKFLARHLNRFADEIAASEKQGWKDPQMIEAMRITKAILETIKKMPVEEGYVKFKIKARHHGYGGGTLGTAD